MENCEHPAVIIQARHVPGTWSDISSQPHLSCCLYLFWGACLPAYFLIRLAPCLQNLKLSLALAAAKREARAAKAAAATAASMSQSSCMGTAGGSQAWPCIIALAMVCGFVIVILAMVYLCRPRAPVWRRRRVQAEPRMHAIADDGSSSESEGE